MWLWLPMRLSSCNADKFQFIEQTRRGFAIAAQSRARLGQIHPVPLKKDRTGSFFFTRHVLAGSNPLEKCKIKAPCFAWCSYLGDPSGILCALAFSDRPRRLLKIHRTRAPQVDLILKSPASTKICLRQIFFFLVNDQQKRHPLDVSFVGKCYPFRCRLKKA